MFFRVNIKLLPTLLLLLLVMVAQEASTQEQNTEQSTITFTATPSNCVALRQGRKCFTKVALTWQVAEVGNFCIYQHSDKLKQSKVIQCWQNSLGNFTEFEFQSNEKVVYQLVSIKDSPFKQGIHETVIAHTSVEVSWVHNSSPRKRRWRLF